MILLSDCLCNAQGGFLLALLHKTWDSPFHLAGVLHRSALALTTRCLCAKKWANPFHLQVFFNLSWSLDQRKGFSISLWCFTPFVLALSTPCLCVKNGITHFTPDVFCMNSLPLQHWSYLTPGHLTFLLLWFDSTTRMTLIKCRALSLSWGGFSRSL